MTTKLKKVEHTKAHTKNTLTLLKFSEKLKTQNTLF